MRLDPYPLATRSKARSRRVMENLVSPRVEQDVPRYYFNVCCDRFEATDVVGEYCRDQGAAHQEALRAARAIVRKQLLAEDLPQHGWIEVEDERHETILRVPLRSVAY